MVWSEKSQFLSNITLLQSLAVIIAFSVSLLATTAAMAASVRLAWEPNTPEPDGYILFIRTEGDSYNYNAPIWAGADTECTISGLIPGTTYFLAIRVYFGSDLSSDSDEISYTPPYEEASTSAFSVGSTIDHTPIIECDSNHSLNHTFHSRDVSPDPTDSMAPVSGIKVLKQEN